MDKFGVHLKSTGLPNTREKEKTRQTTTRKNQPTNMKDIKSMFESKSEGTTGSTSAPVSMGTDFKSRSYTTQKTVTKKPSSDKSAKDEEDLTLFSQFKFSIDANKNTTLERTNSSDSCHSMGSPRGVRKANKDDTNDTTKAQVVKSKVMTSSSKTFQASVDSKIHRVNSREDNSLKQKATSDLIGNLAILRTLPGGSKKSETSASSAQSETSKPNKVFKETSSLLKEKKTSSTDSVNSDKDVGQKSSVSRTKEFSVSKSAKKSSDVSKLSGESKLTKQKELGSSLSPKASEKKFKSDFGLSYNKKQEISVSSGPGLSRQSSTDSVTSEKSSPRSSLKSKGKLKLDQSTASDTGSSGSLSPRVKSFSPEVKPDEKPEWMEKSKELVNKFQTKLKKPVISDFSVIVTTSSVSEETTKSSTSSSSTWPSKSTTPQKTDTVTNTSSTFTKTSVTRTDSGRKSDLHGYKEALLSKEASSSKEFLEKFSKDKELKEEKTDKELLSRKTSSEQFQKLKGGFEQSDDTSKSTQPKPKIEMPNSNQFLERRNSFEKPKPADIAKCTTLKNLKNDGKIVGVKDRISALNEGKGEVVDERFRNKVQTQKSTEKSKDSDQEYHDVAVNRAGPTNDWPTSESESDENMYECIPATDPRKKEEGGTEHRLTRKHGQKSPSSIRKGNNRPSFDLDSHVNDSSSEVTTEAGDSSSKEGTLESTEDGTGIEADVEEYDSDGSGSSGIYEPIDPNWESHKPSQDSTGQEEPPVLPPGRGRHKKKDGKTIGKKLKKFKEKLGSNAAKQNEGSLPKVSSTSSITSNSSSSGLLKKVGKIMKKSKVNGAQMRNGEDPEEIRVCNSATDSSDINEDIYEDEPVQLRAHIGSSGGEDNSGSDIYEQHIEVDSLDRAPSRPPPPPPTAPPAPPVPPRLSLPPVPDKDVPPPRPPSTGKIKSPGDDTPALPPRNRISGNFNLDMVVPISPGGRSGPTWHPAPESYLHGHNVKGSKFNDQVDGGGSSSSSDEAQSGMVRTSMDYIEPDPPVKGRGTLIKQDSVPQEPAPAPPIPPPPVMRNRQKEPLEKRPSSGYAGFKETPQNSVTAPFDDLLIYKRHLDIKEIEDDIVYIDMSDDQLYGTLDRRFTSKFESEPLYQCYHRDKVTKSTRRHTEMVVSEDEDEEPVQMTKPDRGERIYEAVEDIDEAPKKKLSTLEMFGKTGSVLRALWAEMPEVKESGVLEKVSPHERKIQEAMFEIITSEASYLKSLNVLIDVFLMSPEFSSEHSDRCVITRQERHVLFSNIGSVRDTSENFLCDLEASWQKSVFLSDLCDIIYKHAANKFECYIRYCTNQTFQERATQELQKRPETSEVIKRLERNPSCQGLPMISFLLLPMQRITRLPLLVDAICHRLDPDTPKHKSACKALDALNKVVKKCNDGAKRMQQTEQMCHLARNLEFKVKEIPLISASRFLVKQGELTRIVTDSTSRIPFGKRASSKQPVYIYLFNDLLIVSKRKKCRSSYSFTPQNISALFNNTYVVTDYAKRNALHVENIDTPEKAKLLPNSVPSGMKNLFIVALLENHEQRQVELVLSCKSPSDRTRWIDALSPTAKESDSEKIYEEWDCPQVQCIKRFNATEPDELGLEESDVVNVFKKMGDGWYEGERIRDGEKGWFPSDHTEEIMNSHVRSRNLRLRYRLMLASSQEYSNASVQGGMIKT
ncbi:uncharacterized protein LOC134233571 isoform X1 [Saccostrea cucullata]|uniref:uncharacterized protein LOC134233571 isoform X1 n=1 Tax=Saccostrea cuccullata TaxID=36930 RepID=UPI002ED45D3E